VVHRTDPEGMGSDSPRILLRADLPIGLRDVPQPPEQLHLHGELPRGPAVAIVGTRYPSPRGVRFTEELAAALARHGVAVLSGGAEGIDTAAHRGALAARGVTVVVAPAGLDTPFPEENAGLFREIVDSGGAYLSLVPDGTKATRHVFFRRNSYLVALAHAVVVTEAPVRSGARNAAKWARELGRPLLAVPFAPWQRRGGGSVLELRLGASVCTSARDVLRVLRRQFLTPIPVSPEPGRFASEQPQLPFSKPEVVAVDANTQATLVRDAVAAGARTIDEICDQTSLGPGAVQHHVLTLTLEGVLAPDPGSGWLEVRVDGLVSASKILKSKE
jgi:DNA processing protein